MHSQTILNVFPASDGHSRLVVAVEKSDSKAGDEQSGRLVLRQETFSSAVGWFTQSCIPVEPEQVAGLKMMLTSTHGGVGNKQSLTKQSVPRPRVRGTGPSVLAFDQAVHAAG
ncbi:hypothetical protein N9N28_07765 [Rubripirellula amarantea]|nr:hypothetical protein [Rubripirellula amarantea]